MLRLPFVLLLPKALDNATRSVVVASTSFSTKVDLARTGIANKTVRKVSRYLSNGRENENKSNRYLVECMVQSGYFYRLKLISEHLDPRQNKR